MTLLLDEMYPPSLAEALRTAGIDAATVAERKLAGASDAEVFARLPGANRRLTSWTVPADRARLT